MTGWRLHLAGPADRELILRADVFDGPAEADRVAAFMGTDDRPDPRSILILALGAGGVAGFVSGQVQDHPDKPRSLFIIELGVNEQARRQGIGAALVQAIRAEGRRRGCRSSWVLTEGGNAPARALYRAAGGAETADVVMYDWDEDGADQDPPLRPPALRG